MNRIYRVLRPGEMILEGDCFRPKPDHSGAEQDAPPGLIGRQSAANFNIARIKPYPDYTIEDAVWMTEPIEVREPAAPSILPPGAIFFNSRTKKWYTTTDQPCQGKHAPPYHYAVEAPDALSYTGKHLGRVYPGKGYRLIQEGEPVPAEAELGTMQEGWFIDWAPLPEGHAIIGTPYVVSAETHPDLNAIPTYRVRTTAAPAGFRRASSITALVSQPTANLIAVDPASESVLGMILRDTKKWLPDTVEKTTEAISEWLLSTIEAPDWFRPGLVGPLIDLGVSGVGEVVVPTRWSVKASAKPIHIPPNLITEAASSVLERGGTMEQAAASAANAVATYYSTRSAELLANNTIVSREALNEGNVTPEVFVPTQPAHIDGASLIAWIEAAINPAKQIDSER